jgi:hypothetical protein
MMVFGSGALAGFASSLIAYIARLLGLHRPGRVIFRDLLRVAAMMFAISAGAAFLVGLNMMSLTVPQGPSTHPESTHPESTPKNKTPSAH